MRTNLLAALLSLSLAACSSVPQTTDGGSGGGATGGGRAGGSGGGSTGGGSGGGSGGSGGGAGGAMGPTTIYMRLEATGSTQIELYRETLQADAGVTDFGKLSHTITAAGGTVGTVVQLSPDGRKLAYVGDDAVTNQKEVFVVDLTVRPPAPRKVSAPYTATGANALSLQWSPDSTKIAYRADGEVDQTFEVYVANLSAMTAAIASPGVGTATGTEETYAWSPDSRYLAIRAMTSATETDVYVTDTSNAPPYMPVLASSGRAAPGSDVELLVGWLPSGATLAYVGDLRTLNQDELFTVAMTASGAATPVPVFSSLAATSDVSTNQTLGLANDFSPDKSRLAIRVLDTAGDTVYVSSTAGGALSTPVSVANGDVNGYAWSPRSTRLLLYMATGTERLQLVDVSGSSPGTPMPIAAPSVSGANPAGNYGFSPDGNTVVYRNSLIGMRDLFAVDVAGTQPGPPRKVSGTISATGTAVGVTAWAFSGDGRLAYLSEQRTDDVVEAFLVDLALPGTPTSLHPPPVTMGNVIDLTFSPDSKFVLFRGDLQADGQFRLFAFDVLRGVAQMLSDVTPALPSGATGVQSFFAQ